MAENKNKEPLQHTETTEVKPSLAEQIPGLDKATEFLKKYQNILLAGVVVIVGAIIFMLMRGGGSSAANELAAEKAIAPIRQYMQMDSFNIVLNGNDSLGVTMNVKKFIDKYKNTTAGQEAKLYAAECYIYTGKFADAIKMVKDAGPFGPQLTARKYALLGDAYSEKGMNANPVAQKDCDEAIDYYKKAADEFSADEVNAAAYLVKAAKVYAQTGKAESAKKLLLETKDKYPGMNAQTQTDLEKMLGQLGVEN